MTFFELLVIIVLFSASYIQAATGFAFGLIAIAVISVLGVIGISETVMLINILGLINHLFSIKGWRLKNVDQRAILYFLILCVPATLIGVQLLEYLETTHVATLKIVMGSCIILSCLLMLLKVEHLRERSGNLSFALSGFLSGMMGGMFATFGPPFAYVMYRQPFEIKVIRDTLLSAFLIISTFRFVASYTVESVNISVDLYFLTEVVAVMVGAMLARSLPIPLSDTNIRRVAFCLLLVAGSSLVLRGGSEITFI